VTKELKKKVIVIEPTALGSNIVESTGEILSKTKWHMKRNPNKKEIFFKNNKWREKLTICHYKGNDFLNVFVNGGMHSSRFVLTLEDAKDLGKTLLHCIHILYSERKKRSNEPDKKSSNIAQK